MTPEFVDRRAAEAVVKIASKGVGFETSPARDCGWSANITYPDGKQVQLRGHEENSTHERMDLLACLVGLEAFEASGIPEGTPIAIYSNCQTLVVGMLSWKSKWIRLGWRRQSGPLANADLWKRLDVFDRKYVLIFPDAAEFWSHFKQARDLARYEANLEHLGRFELSWDDEQA